MHFAQCVSSLKKAHRGEKTLTVSLVYKSRADLSRRASTLSTRARHERRRVVVGTESARVRARASRLKGVGRARRRRRKRARAGGSGERDSVFIREMLERGSSERKKSLLLEAELRRVNSLPQLRVVGFDAATAPGFGGSPTISKRAAAIRVDDFLAGRESSWGSAASTGSSSLTRSLSLDPRKSCDDVELGKRSGESDAFSNDSMDGDLGGPRQRFSESAIDFDARGGVDDDAPPRSSSAEPIEIQYNGTRNWRGCVFSRLTFRDSPAGAFSSRSAASRRAIARRIRAARCRRCASTRRGIVPAGGVAPAGARRGDRARKPSALRPLSFPAGRDWPIACAQFSKITTRLA